MRLFFSKLGTICLLLLPAAVIGQSTAGGGTSKVDTPTETAPPAPQTTAADEANPELKKPGRSNRLRSLPGGMYDNLEAAMAAPDQVISLDLKSKKLTEIPEAIRNFKNLEHLDCAFNQIKEIPSWLGELKGLRTLALNKNLIGEVPASIGGLLRLESLILLDNPIAKVDPAIGSLQLLTSLQISGNGDPAAFQPAIMQLKGLHTLRLWNFGFAQAPKGIEGLNQLETLCLAHNKLVEFPTVAFTLKHLYYLNIGDNKVATVPAGIEVLQDLSYMGIYDNPIAEFPVQALSGLTHLQWFAAWGTQLSADQQRRIEAERPALRAAFTNDDVH